MGRREGGKKNVSEKREGKQMERKRGKGRRGKEEKRRKDEEESEKGRVRVRFNKKEEKVSGRKRMDARKEGWNQEGKKEKGGRVKSLEGGKEKCQERELWVPGREGSLEKSCLGEYQGERGLGDNKKKETLNHRPIGTPDSAALLH